MPLIDEIKNTFAVRREMSEEQQKDIAQMLSRRIVAHDYARTMSFDQVMELTELAIADLQRTIDEMKR